MLEMTQLDLNAKRVLIREDLNVPLCEGKITDYTRIERAIPSLQQALSQGAKVRVMSHLGRPQEGIYDASLSLRPVAEALQKRLDYKVHFATDWIDGVCAAEGELVVCENVRFLLGEADNDPVLAQKMAALCDVFVMDAFATAHRAQASTVGVIEAAAVACAGPLLQAELTALSAALLAPKKPLCAIIGGAKVSSKMQVLINLLDRVDSMIVGGGMANTLLYAAGFPVADSLYEADWVDAAKDFLSAAAERGVALPLPVDVVVAAEIGEHVAATTKPITAVTGDDKILDIGPETIAQYRAQLAAAQTIVWNGPVGVFECSPFRAGTESIAQAVAVSDAFSIAGGGDTIAAINMFALADKISYISTGGGAFLEFLEAKPLPAVVALERRNQA